MASLAERVNSSFRTITFCHKNSDFNRIMMGIWPFFSISRKTRLLWAFLTRIEPINIISTLRKGQGKLYCKKNLASCVDKVKNRSKSFPARLSILQSFVSVKKVVQKLTIRYIWCRNTAVGESSL